MTLNCDSDMKGYMCNIVHMVKKEWICIITTSQAKSLYQKELG